MHMPQPVIAGWHDNSVVSQAVRYRADPFKSLSPSEAEGLSAKRSQSKLDFVPQVLANWSARGVRALGPEARRGIFRNQQAPNRLQIFESRMRVASCREQFRRKQSRLAQRRPESRRVMMLNLLNCWIKITTQAKLLIGLFHSSCWLAGCLVSPCACGECHASFSACSMLRSFSDFRAVAKHNHYLLDQLLLIIR